jgi:hypothetical protein
MFFSSNHLAANNIIFFFVAAQYSIVHIYYIFLIQSSVMGHLICFQSLAVVNSAIINMGVQVALSYPEAHLSICPGVVLLDGWWFYF